MRFGKFIGTIKVSVAGSVLVVALAGCSESTPTGKLPATPSSTPTSAESSAAPTSTAPTTTYTPEEQAVIDQYKGYYNAFYSLPTLTEPNIRAAFEPFTAPNYLTNLTNGLLQYASEGKRPTGYVVFGLVDVSIEGSVANTVECRDGTTELIVSNADGAILGRGGPGTLVKVRLDQLDGRWLVTETEAAVDSC